MRYVEHRRLCPNWNNGEKKKECVMYPIFQYPFSPMFYWEFLCIRLKEGVDHAYSDFSCCRCCCCWGSVYTRRCPWPFLGPLNSLLHSSRCRLSLDSPLESPMGIFSDTGDFFIHPFLVCYSVSFWSVFSSVM